MILSSLSSAARFGRAALLGGSALLLTACPASEPTEPPAVTTVATATSGASQSKEAGAASDEMIVRITTSGEPVSGATVTWTTTGGTLASSTSTTDAQGLARNTLTSVGAGPASVTVRATSAGANASFAITVAAPPPGSIEKVGNNPTNTAAGAADSVKVRVLDASSTPRAGATVTFAVTAGGGSVSPTTVTTDAQGFAAALWTRGSAGVNTAIASAAGQTGNPVTFMVEAVSVVSSLSYGPRVAVLDSGTTTSTLAVVVKDGAGATMTGQAVTFTSRTPAVATVTAEGQVTGLARGQAVIVASVTANGTTYSDSLLAVVAVPGGPVVLTDLARFDMKRDTTFTVTILADMRTSTDKIGSGKMTLTWDAAVLTYQSDAEGASGVNATVNATNASTGSLVLAFANSTGFGGKVEVRKVTFTASTTVTAGSLALTTQEAFAAATYESLLPTLVSVSIPIFTR